MLINSTYAYEQDISMEINVSPENIKKFNVVSSASDVYNVLEEIKTKLNIINGNVVGKLDVRFNFNDSNYSASESNLNKRSCSIIINKELGKAIFMNNFRDELIFTVLHEISHCILSKDVLNNGIGWKVGNFSELEKENINANLVFETAYLYGETKDCNKIKIINDCKVNNLHSKEIPVIPLFVYHEMFSDVNAVLLIAKIFPNRFDVILEQVYQRRLSLWRENNRIKHPTHYALGIIKDFYLMNLLVSKSDYDDLISISEKVAQRGFLDYLTENNNGVRIK